MLKFFRLVFALVFGAAWMLSATSVEAKRVALVIGNESYQPASTAPADTRVATPPPSVGDPLSKPQRLKDLRNPVRDAKAFAEVLKAAGYDVIDRYNLDFKGFNAALDEFAEKSAGAIEAIVFFAGHGMKITQREGRTVREKNVLAPIDAEISCDLSRSSGVVIEMEKVMRAVEGVPKQVFIFDACRDDPFQHCPGRSGSSGSGFDRAALPIGAADSATSIIVAYSTGDGKVASDGNVGSHSPFADVLLRELRDPDKKRYVFRELLELTSEQVGKATNQRQIPAVVGTGSRPDMGLAGSGCLTTVALIAEVKQGQDQLALRNGHFLRPKRPSASQ